MSLKDVAPPPPETAAASPADAPRARARPGAGAWVRLALACALLAGSGGLRVWQARRVGARLSLGARPAFDLRAVPMTLGPWEGEATAIDPAIARGTGADVVVTRRYVHRDTGVALDLILLFGPAVNMYIHLPELCYPAAGFTLAEGPAVRGVGPGSAPARVPFRSLVYTRGEGAAADRQEVYYTWRYHDRWTPDVGTQKFFERVPGMYKVHLARRVRPGERRDAANPSEAFLGVLVPELERRLNPADAAPPPPAPTAHRTSTPRGK